MSLKEHKKGITKLFIMMLILCLLCFGLFACCTYLEQQSKTLVDMSEAELVQLDEPEEDAPAMKMTTSKGVIIAELYPEQAPQYVAQFTELAESGYYDNTYVFSVENGVYFEAGSPNQDGTLADDADESKEKVEQETSGDLWPFRGAFCVPTTTQEGNIWDRFTGNMTTYCGTRFVVCDTITFDESAKEELESVSDDAEEISEAFLSRGGIPNYSQQMTVFAQAYGEESFATIDAITDAETETASSEDGYMPPTEDIQIISVEIGTYGEFTTGDSEENS